MYPPEFRYTKDHEWIRAEGAAGTVGITDYAQKELGDVVFVELPQVGDQVTAGKVLGTIESVKAVSDIYAPVTGEVTAVNTKLDSKPEVLNRDPHGEGWLLRVRLADPSETGKLMTAEEYEGYVRQQKAT